MTLKPGIYLVIHAEHQEFPLGLNCTKNVRDTRAEGEPDLGKVHPLWSFLLGAQGKMDARMWKDYTALSEGLGGGGNAGWWGTQFTAIFTVFHVFSPELFCSDAPGHQMTNLSPADMLVQDLQKTTMNMLKC